MQLMVNLQQTELYEVMNVEDFVSSFGGIIGLYVGMSFLTVFQAFDYLLMYRRLCKEAAKKKKGIEPSDLKSKKSMKHDESEFIDKPVIY